MRPILRGCDAGSRAERNAAVPSLRRHGALSGNAFFDPGRNASPCGDETDRCEPPRRAAAPRKSLIRP